jgi:hypothetical protein
MAKRISIVMGVLTLIFAVGCQPSQRLAVTDPDSIPDQIYNIATYRGKKPLSYAVLFDIPDDGMPVVMFHSYRVKQVGADSPGTYIEYFQTRLKGYRTLEVKDRDGRVRGYLMMSNFIYYEIYEQPVGERIVVRLGRQPVPVLDAGAD